MQKYFFALALGSQLTADSAFRSLPSPNSASIFYTTLYHFWSHYGTRVLTMTICHRGHKGGGRRGGRRGHRGGDGEDEVFGHGLAVLLLLLQARNPCNVRTNHPDKSVTRIGTRLQKSLKSMIKYGKKCITQ